FADALPEHRGVAAADRVAAGFRADAKAACGDVATHRQVRAHEKLGQTPFSQKAQWGLTPISRKKGSDPDFRLFSGTDPAPSSRTRQHGGIPDGQITARKARRDARRERLRAGRADRAAQ